MRVRSSRCGSCYCEFPKIEIDRRLSADTDMDIVRPGDELPVFHDADFVGSGRNAVIDVRSILVCLGIEMLSNFFSIFVTKTTKACSFMLVFWLKKCVVCYCKTERESQYF